MSDLERDLRRLGPELEYPPTPPLARSVAARLEADASERRSAPGWRRPARRTLRLAATLALLLAGTVLAAVPGARHAVLDFVGLRGATVERVPSLREGVVARPGAGLGRSFPSVEAARASLAFEPLLPAGLGEPSGVFVADDPPGGQLSLAYPAGPETGPPSRYTGVGLLINELRGDFAPGFYGKMAPRGVRIERLEIEGRPAVWVGGLHEFQYLGSDGHFRIDRTRLAGPVLLYQRGPVLVRIEGRISRARATAIARRLSR